MSGESTGWHVDDEGDVHDHALSNPKHGGHDDCIPVLVVPVAEARETIARALNAWDGGEIPWDDPTWTGERKRKSYRLRADAVLAALAPTSEGGRRDG